MAHAYAQRDFAVFPVSQSKVPLTEHGHKDATTDPRQIEAWNRVHPDANIGVRCDWFFVVDADFGKGGELVLERWRQEHGEFPTTWKVRTGSGGLHFYFRHSPELDAVPLGKLYDGLDIKGGGRGYVLAPPSRNKNGAYKWIVPPTVAPLAQAPWSLIEEIIRMKRPRQVEPIRVDLGRYAGIDRVERARQYARAIPGAVEGDGGDNTTWLAANKVARGFALNEDEAFAVLWTAFNPRCRPPWTEKALRRLVSRALAIGDMPIGALLAKSREARAA